MPTLLTLCIPGKLERKLSVFPQHDFESEVEQAVTL